MPSLTRTIDAIRKCKTEHELEECIKWIIDMNKKEALPRRNITVLLREVAKHKKYKLKVLDGGKT